MKKVVYDTKQVRLFLVLLLVFLSLLTLKFIPRGAVTKRLIWLAVEVGIISFFLLLPRIFFPLFRLIMIGTGHIGNVIFGLISIIVFYLILTPLALVMRLCGKKFMPVRCQPGCESYYEDADPPTPYEKQF